MKAETLMCKDGRMKAERQTYRGIHMKADGHECKHEGRDMKAGRHKESRHEGRQTLKQT